MKILALDLETSPLIAHVWGMWQQNVGLNQLMESTRVICWGARWTDKKSVIFRSEFHHGREQMLEDLHAALDEADALLTWNGASFDMKHCNREFLEAGMLPPSPLKQIDLMRSVKKTFRFPSNKLQYVSRALGLEGKAATGGHDLWVQCLAGNRQAWATMRKYQKQDVDLLIDLYQKLLPWIDNHPSVALYDESEGCPNCGSGDLRKEGFAFTGLGKYQRFVCKACGRWSKSGKRIAGVELRSV